MDVLEPLDQLEDGDGLTVLHLHLVRGDHGHLALRRVDADLLQRLLDLPHLARPQVQRRGDTLPLDEMTRRNLELVEPLRAGARGVTLLETLDRHRAYLADSGEAIARAAAAARVGAAVAAAARAGVSALGEV